eukprot:g3083.t1
MLRVGDVVHARVVLAIKDIDPTLTCCAKENQTKKDWVTGESVYGELKDGTIFRCSLSLATKLRDPNCVVLNELGSSIPFEIVVGSNGMVWVDSETTSNSILIMNAIRNSEHISETQTKKRNWEAPGVAQTGYKMRQKLLPEIEAPNFLYKDAKAADASREMLLNLLEWLLKIGHGVRDTKTCRRLIIGILRRREFSLEHIGFGVGVSDSRKLPASQISLDLLRRYRKLLADCVLFCSSLVEKGWVPHKILLKFCNQVLAIAFFRLPIAGIVLRLLTNLGTQPPKSVTKLPSPANASEEEEISVSAHDETELKNAGSTSKVTVTAEEHAKASENVEEEGEAGFDSTFASRADFESQRRIRTQFVKCKRLSASLATEESASDAFINANPSLFTWNWFTSEWDTKFQAVIMRTEKKTGWLSRMVAGCEGFMTFFNEYIRHICFVCAGPAIWTLVPGYETMLEIFIREFTDCGRHLCSARTSLKSWSTAECRAALECSCQVAVNTTLVNVLVMLAYENCNMHNLKDVENCISLLEMWFTVVGTKGAAFDTATPPELAELCKDMRSRKDALGCDRNLRFSGAHVVDFVCKSSKSTAATKKQAASVLLHLVNFGLIERVGDFKGGDRSNLSANGIAVGASHPLHHESSVFKFTDDTDFQKKEGCKSDRPRLPSNFDITLFAKGISMLLSSSHFQVVLKTLAFLYNHEVIFHGPSRVELVENILLKGQFNRLFMHWMYEVRRYFTHILVYKIFRTSRLWLPCSSDEMLVNKAETERNATSNSISRGYRETMRVASMYRRSREKTKRSSGFFGSLFDAVMNPSKAKEEHEQAREAFFAESLEEEEKALDLLLASKLDSFLQCVIAQQDNPKLRYFDPKLQPYARKALAEYTALLEKYYEEAWEKPGETVTAPSLAFNMLDGK